MEVVSDQDITQHVHHHDDEDEIQVQLIFASADNVREPLEVNQIGTRLVLPPSEFDSMIICSDIALCPDPAFETDDVSKEPVDVERDVGTAQAIVPRVGLEHIND